MAGRGGAMTTRPLRWVSCGIRCTENVRMYQYMLGVQQDCKDCLGLNECMPQAKHASAHKALRPRMARIFIPVPSCSPRSTPTSPDFGFFERAAPTLTP